MAEAADGAAAAPGKGVIAALLYVPTMLTLRSSRESQLSAETGRHY